MSWNCPQCDLENQDEVIQCPCGYRLDTDTTLPNDSDGSALLTSNRNQLLMTCPSCKGQVSKRAQLCPKCGFNLVRPCNICGQVIPIGSSRCPQCGDPAPFESEPSSGESPISTTNKAVDVSDHSLASETVQKRLDRLLFWGIVLSFLWMGGIGSLASFVIGKRAKNLINSSEGKLQGIGKAKWCIVVGTIGILFWGPILLVCILNNLLG